MSSELAIREPSLATQTITIASRSVSRVLRQPAYIGPPILFPLILVTINSQGLARATEIPGFPAPTYLSFILVTLFIQGALFATSVAGIALGQDIQAGFLDRLALTPMRGSALLLGQLAGGAVMGVLASIVYISYGLLRGVHFEAGIAGMVVLMLMSALTALAFSGLGAMLALRSGSPEALQGIFPLFFASIFLSATNMPLNLIQATWFKVIASINPVTYMVAGMRSLIITGWDWTALGVDLAIVAAIIALSLTLGSRALRTRLGRA